MNKRTRVLNAMDKNEVDHVPVGFWHHFGGKQAAGEDCVRAHIDFYRETDADMIKIMSDGFFAYPITVEINKVSDWYKLAPLGREHPFLKEQVRRVKRIREEVGEECAVFYNVFAPFSSLRFGGREELVARHLKEDKAAIIHALDCIQQDNADLAEMVITEGKADGIYYPLQGAELFRFSYDQYRELVTPSDLYVLERANRFSDYNIAHLCGWAGDKNRLEVWRDYPAKAFNWAVYVEDMTLEQGREYFGGRCCLGGFKNTRPAPIFYGTKNELRDFAKDTIRSFGKTGLILGADCTIPAEVSNERMRWIAEAAREI